MIYLTADARFAALTELIVWIILIAGVTRMNPNSLEAAPVQYIETGDPTARSRMALTLFIVSLIAGKPRRKSRSSR